MDNHPPSFSDYQSDMEFTLLNTDGHARRGRLNFARGVVETPIFMPVGTYGAVKSLTPEDLM